ncbi:hypothetical protein AAHE18_08G244000 [Arachis hypogaea]
MSSPIYIQNIRLTIFLSNCFSPFLSWNFLSRIFLLNFSTLLITPGILFALKFIYRFLLGYFCDYLKKFHRCGGWIKLQAASRSIMAFLTSEQVRRYLVREAKHLCLWNVFYSPWIPVPAKHCLETLNFTKRSNIHTLLLIVVFQHFHHVILMNDFVFGKLVPVSRPVPVQGPNIPLLGIYMHNSSCTFRPLNLVRKGVKTVIDSTLAYSEIPRGLGKARTNPLYWSQFIVCLRVKPANSHVERFL